MFRKNIFFFGFIVFSTLLSASEAYDTGYNLFASNKPAEAIPYFVTAMEEPGVSPSVYMYLGIAYYQTGQYAQSVDVFKKGLSATGTNKRILAFNAGNSAYAMKDFVVAEQMYSLAAAADPMYADPVLNRANARLSQNKLEDALTDYQQYLVLDPASTQRTQVEAVIKALQAELVYQEQESVRLAQEAERMKAEEERIRAENERIAEAQAEAQRLENERIAAEQAAEAERRRKLLEDVAASLQNTDTTSVNAGTEGVIDYEYESELD